SASGQGQLCPFEVEDPACRETPVEPSVEVGRVPSRLKSPPLAQVEPLPPDLDLIAGARKGSDGRYYVWIGESNEALTLNPELQDRLTQILRQYQTPYAAVVVLQPHTGRVLAMAEYSERNRTLRGLTTKAVFPAASIFKIVTASALLDAGVKP